MKVLDDYYSWIDRLQKCSEVLHPERKWSNDFYYDCAFAWIGKEEELKRKVLELENKIGV